jgi:hypothetical protein
VGSTNNRLLGKDKFHVWLKAANLHEVLSIPPKLFPTHCVLGEKDLLLITIFQSRTIPYLNMDGNTSARFVPLFSSSEETIWSNSNSQRDQNDEWLLSLPSRILGSPHGQETKFQQASEHIKWPDLLIFPQYLQQRILDDACQGLTPYSPEQLRPPDSWEQLRSQITEETWNYFQEQLRDRMGKSITFYLEQHRRFLLKTVRSQRITIKSFHSITAVVKHMMHSSYHGIIGKNPKKPFTSLEIRIHVFEFPKNQPDFHNRLIRWGIWNYYRTNTLPWTIRDIGKNEIMETTQPLSLKTPKVCLSRSFWNVDDVERFQQGGNIARMRYLIIMEGLDDHKQRLNIVQSWETLEKFIFETLNSTFSVVFVGGILDHHISRILNCREFIAVETPGDLFEEYERWKDNDDVRRVTDPVHIWC